MQKYTISRENNKINIFRDLLILSASEDNKKGVIIIEYAETFDAVCVLFKIEKLLEKYIIILESSWAGACDPTFFMFIRKACPVIVEFPENSDCQFIASLKSNLIPWKKGAGDWLSKQSVTKNTTKNKDFDIIMVANWAKHKNHRILFRSIKRIKNKKIRLLLIGFEYEKRQKEDILNEFNAEVGNNIEITLTIMECLSPEKVIHYLEKSKTFILLTCKEGANRALSESFAAGTPAIVYKHIKGGAAERINNKTGVLSDYNELYKKIEYMLENYSRYSPKDYILSVSNSETSTHELAILLKQICTQENILCNLNIVEKKNNPNFEYVDINNYNFFEPEFQKLIQLFGR